MHNVPHYVHMTRTTMESRGLRLHPALWEAIEREAKQVKLRPTDYLRRRIEDFFSFDPDGHIVPSNVHQLREPSPPNSALGDLFE